jgi:lipopolysaccharide/colanic/teichoic acid biosynthesis glycosyltransferase
MASFYEFLAGKVPVDHISNLWFYLHSLMANRLYFRHLKRVADIIIAVSVLLLTLPFFFIIPLLIKLDSRGPVFFRQERLGQEGKPFHIIKFRTMVHNAERHGPQWAAKDDPRVTRVGWFLRKFRLDELPQLLNILQGDMSFIGPRPEREIFVREFQELVPAAQPGTATSGSQGIPAPRGYKEKIPYYSYRLLVKPGITGWAQVMYQYAATQEETKEKLQYDLYYVKNMGFFLDMSILLKTVRIVLLGRGT